MGVILGSSSLVGAIFDIIASKYLKVPHYRKLYGSMFLLSFSFLMLLYFASTVWIFVLAMALWGIYWDLLHFANFDFISRTLPEKEHTSAFGIQGVFQSLGILIAPILAGLLIETTISHNVFVIAGVMLLASIIIYIGLLQKSEESNIHLVVTKNQTINWSRELTLWIVIGKQLFPVLILTFLIYITDAFFWTIGPLIAENGAFGRFGGLLLAAYSFPSLVIGWFVGSIAVRFGKKEQRSIHFFWDHVFSRCLCL